jgi:hypothetical protein
LEKAATEHEKAATEHENTTIERLQIEGELRRLSIDMNRFDYRSYALSEISHGDDWLAALTRLQVTITLHNFDSSAKTPFFSSFKDGDKESELVQLIMGHLSTLLDSKSCVQDVQSTDKFLDIMLPDVRIMLRGRTDIIVIPKECSSDLVKHVLCFFEVKRLSLNDKDHRQTQGELIAVRRHSYAPAVGLFGTLLNNSELYIYDHPRDNLIRRFGPYGLEYGLKEVQRRLQALPELPSDLLPNDEDAEGGSGAHQEEGDSGGHEEGRAGGRDSQQGSGGEESRGGGYNEGGHKLSAVDEALYADVDALCKAREMPLIVWAW